MSMEPRKAHPESSAPLLHELQSLILDARIKAASAVNAGLTLLYWRIGRRIHQDILLQRRAEYGAELVPTLARRLEADFGTGFGEKNLRRMIQFAEAFPEEEIVVALLRQLSWTHFLALIPLKDPLQRRFYAEMARAENWGTRTLRQKIDGMLFERTAISKKPELLIHQELEALRQDHPPSPDLVFRDPYVLDFLGLKDTFSERDLEQAILRELEAFLLELGSGFTFVARQKRMVIDGEDHALDLLFYHRRLRRLVAIELKLGRFKAAYKGQMELYLRWLEAHEQEPHENSPLGLILCAESAREAVELLRLDEAGIRVAEYFTELPPRKILEDKLHAALARARETLTLREEA